MKGKSLIGQKNKAAGKIVSGFNASVVRFLIKSNVLLFAFKRTGNPVRGLKTLQDIRESRRNIQGSREARKYFKSEGRYFFSENIPGWPSSAFNVFIKNEIDRISAVNIKHPLSTVIFAITSRCRLGCKHCYEWDNLSGQDALSFDDLGLIMRKLKDYGISHIQLSGGEPLERFDDLISLIRNHHKGVDFWLLTSGFGLTSEKALRLREAGLTGADISLDHWDENEHNNSRNNPEAFHWAKEAVKNCLSAGIAVSLSLCALRSFVSKVNLEKFALLAKEWGAGFIRILEPMETGRFWGKDVSLRREHIEIIRSFFMEMNSSDEFLSYPLVTFPGYHQRIVGCQGAGNRYFYIDPKGNIHACPFCRKSAGKATEDDIEDVVKVLKITGCQRFMDNPVSR